MKTIAFRCSVFRVLRLSEDTIPRSLLPTPVQKEIPRHPWLDVFPFLALHDNFIRAGEHLNDDDLCHNLTAFWDTRHSNAALLVWGVPVLWYNLGFGMLCFTRQGFAPEFDSETISALTFGGLRLNGTLRIKLPYSLLPHYM